MNVHPRLTHRVDPARSGALRVTLHILSHSHCAVVLGHHDGSRLVNGQSSRVGIRATQEFTLLKRQQASGRGNEARGFEVDEVNYDAWLERRWPVEMRNCAVDITIHEQTPPGRRGRQVEAK
ncbi:hypothetical protein FB45DRAFT_873863 [Roridomyces roridus]|uniref:Uncharacterized protein n=1 Tax=Roridomyces roridus TaxID=1738132 RepID=A0AAD7FE95_9AGAR|nr:hypothetical protein FB45DRAFT_873863 [Roridomyces roridus]